jgi:hypothetical protein
MDATMVGIVCIATTVAMRKETHTLPLEVGNVTRDRRRNLMY